MGRDALTGGSRKIERSSSFDGGAAEFISGREESEVEEGEERVGVDFVVCCCGCFDFCSCSYCCWRRRTIFSSIRALIFCNSPSVIGRKL